MNDMAKLRVLLPHWIEHNAEHAGEFRKWAERARSAGDEYLAAHVEAAAQRMEVANEDLEKALKHLGGAPEASDHVHHHHDHPH